MKQNILHHILAAALLWTAGIHGLKAQSFEPFSPYGLFSPSVESYQMTRCGNLLPSFYTGAMTFSLPLMTYSDPDFTIPVTLEYSFDGYKPGQHSGSVGYGWYLDCGGVITREVRGIPDEGDLDGGEHYDCRIHGWRQAGSFRDSLEWHSGSIYSIRRNPSDHSSTEDYVRLFEGYDPFSDTPMYASCPGLGYNYSLYDTAPDIYHFRFLGHSGDFMMLPDGNVRVFNSDIPHGELSVRFTDHANDPSYVCIAMTDGDGFEYSFEPEGVSETPNPDSDYPLRPSRSVSSYRLTSITSPNGRKVTFDYNQYYTALLSFQYDTLLEGAYMTNGIWQEDALQGSNSSSFEIRRSFTREAASCLRQVSVFDSGASAPADSLLFAYGQAPGDEGAASCFEQGVLPSTFVWEGVAPVLASVSMYGRDGLADAASFTYQSAPGGTPKTFLHSVTGMKTGEHVFDYALEGFVLPPNDTQCTDHWGYWNGSSISDLRVHLTETEWMYHFVPDPPEPIAIPTPGADTTYIVALPDTTLVRRCAAHLYDQMTDDVKEANAAYSICGALTSIRYPHGGKTLVEYEPNRVTRRINVWSLDVNRTLEPVDTLNAAVSWVVGGVRVRSLIDSTGCNQPDTTRFSYIDPEADGRCSGILMMMPKYAEAAQYRHRVYDFHESQGVAGVATINAIGFNNCCGFVLNRDPHVVYPAVTIIHPDGSETEYRFTSVVDNGLTDGYASEAGVTKHILGPHDWIEYDGRAPTCMVPASADRKNMRGQPKRIVVRNAAGQELKRTEYSYSSEWVTVPHLAFNNILTFCIARYQVFFPLLVSTLETERGVTVRTDRSYNALGQVTVTSTTDGSAGSDTLRLRLRYRHETGDTSRFRTLLDAAAKTRTCGTGEYLLAREQYSYKPGTRKISRIVSETPHTPVPVSTPSQAFIIDAGTGRTGTFLYDGIQRLYHASFPGGAYLHYNWDDQGMHIDSKTVNGAGNETGYSWMDQVGLTGVEPSSGLAETYEYDSRNRPQKIRDADTVAVSVFHYNLKNEQ